MITPPVNDVKRIIYKKHFITHQTCTCPTEKTSIKWIPPTFIRYNLHADNCAKYEYKHGKDESIIYIYIYIYPFHVKRF